MCKNREVVSSIQVVKEQNEIEETISNRGNSIPSCSLNSGSRGNASQSREQCSLLIPLLPEYKEQEEIEESKFPLVPSIQVQVLKKTRGNRGNNISSSSLYSGDRGNKGEWREPSFLMSLRLHEYE